MRRETKRRGIRAISVTALFASLAAATPGIALAAPSDEEIARAREAENAAKMSVAQIEVELASVKSEAEVALQKAMSAAEELNGARYSLEQATQTARQAQADADKAKADYEAGKQEIASIAQTAYRDGGSSLDSIAPYLSADGLRTVETKQATLNSFSASANVKMQKVAALEQVANVMNDAAIQAQAKQAEATAQVETRSAAAQSAANNARNAQAMTAARRDALVAELARKQNTTVELINQREAELEAQRLHASRQLPKPHVAHVNSRTRTRQLLPPQPAMTTMMTLHRRAAVAAVILMPLQVPSLGRRASSAHDTCGRAKAPAMTALVWSPWRTVRRGST